MGVPGSCKPAFGHLHKNLPAQEFCRGGQDLLGQIRACWRRSPQSLAAVRSPANESCPYRPQIENSIALKGVFTNGRKDAITYRSLEIQKQVSNNSIRSIIMALVGRLFVTSVFTSLLLVSFVQADLQNGLIMYLPFDEGQGEVAGDLSGNGHDGKLEGPKWVEGKFGKALAFDGVDNFVEIPFADDFIITDAITLGAWVTANVPFDPAWKGIINAQETTYGPFLLQTGGDSKAEMGLMLGGAWTWLRTSTSLESDVFHQIVGTYDLKNGLHIYFDGKLDDGEGSAGAKPGPIDEAPNEAIAVGHNYGFDGRFWDGEIDEVVIYNRAISEDEVAELFENPPVSAAVSSKDKITSTWALIKSD